MFEESKVNPTWQNLIEYFVRDKQVISPAMISFLNDEDNAKALALDIINIDNPVPNLETVEAFMQALINEIEIDNISYETLLPAIRYDYELDEIKEIGEDKMRLLIEYYLIKPNVENFIKLKEKYVDLHLLFLDKSRQISWQILEHTTWMMTL